MTVLAGQLPCVCCARVFNAHRAAQIVGKPYDMCHPCWHGHAGGMFAGLDPVLLSVECLFEAVECEGCSFDEAVVPVCSCGSCDLHGVSLRGASRREFLDSEHVLETPQAAARPPHGAELARY